jgi:hypothetical protein
MSVEYKNYFINGNGTGMYTISNVGKGVLASFLRGLYTSPSFAMMRIDDYLDMKADKNGKTDSGS